MKLAKLSLLASMLFILVFSSVPAAAAKPPGDTIVDVAIKVNQETGEFDTLIAAVVASPDVLATLSGNGQYTVFAPTDQAFEDAFEELGIAPEDLLGNTELLTDILEYHVAHGRRMANSVVTANRIRMLDGGFTFPEGATLTDNNDRTANIIVTDVEAANGVIHVIDKVVLP